MATLQNFGVSPSMGAGVLQPKMKYHYVVLFENVSFDGIDLTRQVNNCSLPSSTYNPVANKFSYSDTISISFRDDVCSIAARAVDRLMASQVRGEIFSVVIRQLWNNDAVLSRWVLKECIVTDVIRDKQDYASPDALSFTLNISAKTVDYEISDWDEIRQTP